MRSWTKCKIRREVEKSYRAIAEFNVSDVVRPRVNDGVCFYIHILLVLVLEYIIIYTKFQT